MCIHLNAIDWHLMEFEDIAKREEVVLRQRSMIAWLKQGYRNTGFFHRSANARKRISTIPS